MALTLQRIRALDADLSSLDDNQLAQYLHRAYAPDTSFKDFSKTIGYEDPNADGDVARGFKNTFRQLPSLGYGVLAGGGAAAEYVAGEGGIATGIKTAGLKGYREASANLEENTKDSDSLTYSWNKAKRGDFNALADWVQYGVGYAGGQALQMLATGVLGGAAAKMGAGAVAKQLTEKMVASEAAKIAATEAAKSLTQDAIKAAAVANVANKIGQIGATAATGAAAFGMEAGEIGGGLVDQADREGRNLTGSDLARGFAATVAAGGLEFVGDMLGLGALTGKINLGGAGGMLARGAATGAALAPAEAATEYGQTLFEEWGKGNDPSSEESRMQAFDAAGLGALGGGAMGFAGGAVSGSSRRQSELESIPEPTDTRNDIAESNQGIAQAQSVDEAIGAMADELAKPTQQARPEQEQPVSTAAMPRTQYDGFIADAAARHGIPVEFLTAVAMQESGIRQFDANGRPLRPSNSNALGIMQIIPKWHPQFDVNRLTNDAEYNINAGAQFLGELVKKYNGDLHRAAQAYFGSKKPIENKRYADSVMGRMGSADLNAAARANEPPTIIDRDRDKFAAVSQINAGDQEGSGAAPSAIAPDDVQLAAAGNETISHEELSARTGVDESVQEAGIREQGIRPGHDDSYSDGVSGGQEPPAPLLDTPGIAQLHELSDGAHVSRLENDLYDDYAEPVQPIPQSVGRDDRLEPVEIARSINGNDSSLTESQQKPGASRAGDQSAGRDLLSAIDAAASEAALSPTNDLKEPSAAQKEAGNYKKGHVKLYGFDITIENPKGSKRSGVDPDGRPWSVDMAHNYGYIKRSTGADGEHVDVFIGDKPESTKAFIINQVNPRTGKFDEHKIMLGFENKYQAKQGYLKNYAPDWAKKQGWTGGKADITEVSVAELKARIESGAVQKPIRNHTTSIPATAEPEWVDTRVLPAQTDEATQNVSNAQGARTVEESIPTTAQQTAVEKSAVTSADLPLNTSAASVSAAIQQPTQEAILEQSTSQAAQETDAALNSQSAPQLIQNTPDQNPGQPVTPAAQEDLAEQPAEPIAVNPIITTPELRWVEAKLKAQNIESSSPGYVEAVKAAKEQYQAELDNALASAPFAVFAAHPRNQGVPEGAVRQAHEALRKEYSVVPHDSERGSSGNSEAVDRVDETRESERASDEPEQAGHATEEQPPKAGEKPPITDDDAELSQENTPEKTHDDVKFSRIQATQDDLTFAQDVLNELAEIDEFFRFPVSRKTTLDGVMKDIVPDFQYIGDETRNDEKQESGADRRLLFKTDKVKPFYVYERGDDIWLDVSRLSTGDRGAAIYHALGNYARNAGKVFVGDPEGLSDDAVIRRTANMLSLALRFGSTDFMEPSIEQKRGIPELGVVPLAWQGSDVDNTRSLIQTFLENLQNQFPELRYVKYDFNRKQFIRTDTDLPVDWKKFELARGAGVGTAARAGATTARRGAFLQSLVSSESGARPGILELVLSRANQLVTQGGLDRLFSKPSSKTGSTVADVESWLPKRVKRLLDAGKLRVEQSAAAVPQAAEAIDAGGIEGFYDEHADALYLIADNLTQDNLPSVLAHELIHRAEAVDPQLKAAIERFESRLDRSFKSAAAGRGGAIEKAAYRRVIDAQTPASDQAAEYRAYLVSEYSRKPDSFGGMVKKTVQDFIAAIRAVLIRSGLDMGFIKSLTPADLAAMSRYGAEFKAMSENEGTGVLASASAMKSVEANVNRGKTAMTKALLNKATEHRAMFRTGMGWVDFVWGDAGNAADARGRRKGAKGLAHILEARQRKDGLTDAQAKKLLFDLVETIARGKEGEVYQQGNSQSMAITDGKHRVLLAKKLGSNAWMITGYELYPDGASSASDALAPTHSESTPSRNGMGAGNNKITDSKKSSSDIKFSRDTSGDTRNALDEFKRRAGLGAKKTLRDAFGDVLSRGIDANWQHLKDKWEAVKPSLEQGMFDKFLGIKLAEQEILGDVAHSISGYIGARFSTGSSSTMAAVLQHGAPEWRDGIIQRKPDSKGFAEILRPVRDDLENFTAWMVARRADRLFKEGKENNFSREMIDAGLALKQDSYQGVADDIAALNASILDLAEESGLVDPDSRELWESADYIPFYRLIEGQKTAGPRNAKALSHQTSGIRMLKGGANPLSDPLGNMMQNWAHLIDAAMKNSALDKTLKNLEESRFIDKVPRVQFHRALIPKEQIRKLMLESGLPEEVVEAMPESLTEGIAKLWALQAPSDPDIVRVMRNGKSEYYRVNDSLLLNSLVAVNQSPLPGIFKPMRYMKSLLTGAITADPTFMARNFIRDSMHSWTIAEENGFKLGIDSIHGVIKSFKEEGGYIDMMFAGASFQGGYGNYNNPDTARKSMDAILRKKGISNPQGFLDSIVDTPKKYWEIYRTIGDAIENANREAILENAKNAGAEKARYLFEAKDLMDFSMQGNFVLIRAMSDMLPFFNARLIGLYRLMKAGKTEEARSMILKKGASIALFSLALLALNSDNDDYEELEDWDKDQYWHFFIGSAHYRIPKPFELGLIFGTIPERSARFLLGKDTLQEFAARMGHGASDTLAFNPVPQLFRPFLELYANKDMFTDRSIEGMSDEGKLPSARYNAYTSETMRALSEVLPESLGASPKRLEHLVHGYTGAMGMYILGASDVLVRNMQGAPERPTMRMDRVPVVKAFYQESPAMHTIYSTKFYDILRETEQIQRTINAYVKEGRLEDALELRGVHAQKLSAHKRLKKTNKELTELRHRIDAVYRSNLSSIEKRRRIDKLMEQSNKLTRNIVQKTHPYFN